MFKKDHKALELVDRFQFNSSIFASEISLSFIYCIGRAYTNRKNFTTLIDYKLSKDTAGESRRIMQSMFSVQKLFKKRVYSGKASRCWLQIINAKTLYK